jgi:hypothetical protein
LNPQGGLALADMEQHHHARADHRRRVGNAATGDIGGGAVNRFKDRHRFADVGARSDAKAANKPGAEV